MKVTSCGSIANIRDSFNALRADALSLLSGDILIQGATLGIGTSDAAKVKLTTDLLFQIDGQRYRIAAGTEVAFTATTHDIADPDANPREAVYLFTVAAGSTTCTITKGTTAAAGAGVAPATPAGHLVVGSVLIQHDGSAIFDATTTLLSDAIITDTYTDASIFALTSEDMLPY